MDQTFQRLHDKYKVTVAKKTEVLSTFFVFFISYLQNFNEVKFDMRPQLLDHLVDKLDPVHVRVKDPRG